ncbi:potassium channel family protein [Methanosarcina barkeri]|nr:potassium channel family protein [Methanosarcina barkeri]
MKCQKLFFWTLLSFFVLTFMPMVCLADEYREIQASKILNQIEKGEDVNLTNCRIIGEFNLNEIKLENVPTPKYNELKYNESLKSGYCYSEGFLEPKNIKVIKSNIIIHNSIFENNLDFSNCLFTKSFSFVNVNCSSAANFRTTTFGDSAVFGECNFDSFADFSFTTFGDYANFMGSTFGDYAYFSFATFGNSANFMKSIFGNSAYFSSSTFGSSANFSLATFGDSASFQHSIFGDSANFMKSTFGDYTDFTYSTFGDSAAFVFATFGDYANFRYSTFGDSASFSYSAFDDSAFFEEVSFSNTSYFQWANFDDAVDFSGTLFNEVTLNGTDFKEMRVSWNSLENSLVFDGPTYVKLIQNFRSLEQFEDADAAYYQYRKCCQAEKSWTPFSKEGSKWCDILMWFTCGYGVKPFRSFHLGGLIVLLFSFIYLGFPIASWRNRKNAESAQKSIIKTLLSLIPKIDWPNPGISRLSDNNDSNQKVTFWDSFYFSMVTFTTVGYGDWYPKDNFRKWVMFEGFLGWVTLGLFLVTLTNVMMRP